MPSWRRLSPPVPDLSAAGPHLLIVPGNSPPSGSLTRRRLFARFAVPDRNTRPKDRPTARRCERCHALSQQVQDIRCPITVAGKSAESANHAAPYCLQLLKTGRQIAQCNNKSKSTRWMPTAIQLAGFSPTSSPRVRTKIRREIQRRESQK